MRDEALLGEANMVAIRTHYLDTSALVKLFIVEKGSSVLRAYFDEHTVFATTSLCFAETLGVLKTKFVRAELSQNDYLEACADLMAHLRAGAVQIEDIGISELSVFDQVEIISFKYKLDISDAFQILTLKFGCFAMMKLDLAPILITADKELAKAARKEGLIVWYFLGEPHP